MVGSVEMTELHNLRTAIARWKAYNRLLERRQLQTIYTIGLCSFVGWLVLLAIVASVKGY